MEGSIRVIFSEGSSKQSGNNKTTINTKTGQVKTQHEVQKETPANNVPNFINSSLVVSTAKKLGNILLGEAIYEINKNFRLTDNVEGKRDFNIATGMLKRTSKIATMIYAGAISGGPAGAIAGAVVGFTNEAVNIYQGYDQQNIQLRQLDAQLQYSRLRAGYSLTSGSIGENR